LVIVNHGVVVLANSQDATPTVKRELSLPGDPAGDLFTPDGRYLLVADGAGALVIDAAKAESGQRGALIGTLSAPHGAGAVEVATSIDGRFVFVTREISNDLVVFNLHRALAHGLRSSGFVGTVPLGVAPVGLSVSPDGRWLYATSESARGRPGRVGTLSVIDVNRAESAPSHAVVTTVSAGCSPVRVTTSGGGDYVWVTARGSNELLGFSAAALLGRVSHPLVAQVRVGEAPVGLAAISGGTQIVVANSNRFSVGGAVANLSVVDVAAALAGTSAMVGAIPAGRFPREMAALPMEPRLLVGNYLSETIEVVQLPSQ
jgi:DNA-binding beta-propeller fold protein YncE